MTRLMQGRSQRGGGWIEAADGSRRACPPGDVLDRGYQSAAYKGRYCIRTSYEVVVGDGLAHGTHHVRALPAGEPLYDICTNMVSPPQKINPRGNKQKPHSTRHCPPPLFPGSHRFPPYLAKPLTTTKPSSPAAPADDGRRPPSRARSRDSPADNGAHRRGRQALEGPRGRGYRHGSGSSATSFPPSRSSVSPLASLHKLSRPRAYSTSTFSAQSSLRSFSLSPPPSSAHSSAHPPFSPSLQLSTAKKFRGHKANHWGLARNLRASLCRNIVTGAP